MSTTAPDKRISTYNPTVATTIFEAQFPVFDHSDLAVYVNSERRYDYVVTASYVEGVSNNAKVIMNSGVTGNVAIVGDRDPRRQNRFGFGPIAPRDLNLAFDTVEGEVQEARRDIDRSVRSEIGKPGYIIDPDLVDGDTPMKLGDRFVPGPNLPNLAASLIAEATAQANRSHDEADRSEAARDIAAGYASDAVSQGNVPIYGTLDGMEALSIPLGINAVRVNGLHSAGDGGGGLYIRADGEPSHTRKWQDANGAWFEDISKPIFIAATGQSNFEILRAKNWSPARNLRIWDNTIADIDDVGSAFVEPDPTLIGAPLAFANAIALANPGQTVFLVVVADGGQPISQWLPGASAPDIYAALKANVEPALSAANVSEIDVMLWWQGETGGGQQSYISDFETVQSRFKSETWFRDGTPLVVFGVSPSNIGGGSVRKQINMTLQACCNKAPASRMFVNTGQFSSASYWVDQNHMTADGYENVGRMAAYQFLGRSAGNSPGLSVDFETGNVGIGMTFTQAGFARNRNAYGNPTPAVTSLFHGVEVDGTYPEMRLHGYGSASGIGGLFTGCASGGTGAEPTKVKAGALLAALQGAGRTADGVGGSTGIGAVIRIMASEDWAPTARGCQIEFMVPENGTGNAVLAGSVRNNRDWVFERNIIFKPQPSAIPSINGQMAFELVSDTSLRIRVRGSDGVVRSATLPLS